MEGDREGEVESTEVREDWFLRLSKIIDHADEIWQNL